ncbi:cytochrome c oxidase assembly protein, partial [Roseisolibacter sp. H3M3-2]|uniref:cytochrome c oxidase assembly protein n=1 Tax=Roseisolibacter sp. H3M3-2 TaxID=3031323 RepID=UPI0023DA4414
RRRPVAAAWRAVRAPLPAAALHLLAVAVWHLPGPYQAALRHEGVHALEHASFFGSALLFWWALLHARGAARGPALVGLFVAMLVTGALGALLATASRLWYPAYAATTAPWGLLPLEDQELAGIIMWVPGGIAYLLAALAVLAAVLRDAGPRPAPRALGAVRP